VLSDGENIQKKDNKRIAVGHYAACGRGGCEEQAVVQNGCISIWHRQDDATQTV